MRLRGVVLRKLDVHPLQATTDDLLAVTRGVHDKSTLSTYTRQVAYSFADFQRLGWRDDNPAAPLKPVPRPTRPPRPLPQHQVDALVEHDDPLIRAMSVLGYYAGLRIHEVAELPVTALEEGEHGPQLRIDGKGDRTAVIPAHPKVVEVFDAWARGRRRGLLLGYDTAALHRRWRRATDRMGMPEATFHRLRHSIATHLHRSTGDLLLVSRMLRHASIRSTEQYAMLDDGRLFRAVEGL